VTGRPITPAELSTPAQSSTGPGGRLNHAAALIHHLPEPFALVSGSGEALAANLAFEDLAKRLGVAPGPLAVFGDSFRKALDLARSGHERACLLSPTAGQTPRAVYHVSFLPTPDGCFGVRLRDVTEESRAQLRIARAEQRLGVLRDLGQTLSGVVDLEGLTERIEIETRRVLPTRNLYIALHDAVTGMVTFPRYMEDGEWREMRARPFSNGMTEYLLRHGTPLMVNRDVAARAEALGIDPVGRPCLAWLGAPMIADGTTVGVIAIQDFEREDAYDEHDLELLTIIAGQAAAAVKTARSLAIERRAYRDLAEAQSRLLESERLRGITETVGALNHEVNNPLAAIVGNAQLLLLRPADLAPGVEPKVVAMLEAARRIQRVTNKMATLIQASTMLYPGRESILDVHASVADPLAAGPPRETPGR
jgi:GAF domain-containing protein